jgi:hypothetical protein
MKRIILCVIILGSLVTSIAQVDKKAILETLRSELIPQRKNMDYNPYKYSREEFIISCLELRTEIESDDCENINELIEMFYNDTTGLYNGCVDYISYISRFQCQKVYDFLANQIKSNPSEADRCNAIVLLAWSLNMDYLPCILEYAKKDFLSVQEKLALGGAFMIFSVYTFNTDLKEESIKFLDRVCYDSSLKDIQNIHDQCDACYFKLGGDAAINYYTSRLKQGELKEVLVAIRLAELGEYEKAFPIFVESIQSGITNKVLWAMNGLAIIGTKEATRLIEEQTQSKNEKIAKKAQEIFKNIERR